MAPTTYKVATVDIEDETRSATSVTFGTLTEALDRAKEWKAEHPDLAECGMKVQVFKVQDGIETIVTRGEKQDERRKQWELKKEWHRKHTIKHIDVLDAYESKPQYQGEYNEDGERPVLNHPHAWFILVTLADGTRWFSRESTPFLAFPFYGQDDLKKNLERGYRYFNQETGESSDEWSPLFQAGVRYVTNLEGLIAKARMEERANAVSHARVLDPEPSEWGRWPYSERGSAAWEAEMHAHEMSERRNPNNW